MLVNEYIVIVGQQPWDTTLGSNCKDIALEFSKHNQVLYVNSPLDRFTAITGKNDAQIQKRKEVIAGKQPGLVKIKENLWNLYPDCLVESINWLKPFWLFDWVNRYNNRQFATAIKNALAVLGFNDYILFNDNELIKCFYLTAYLHPKLKIYYSRDYILSTPYWKKHGFELEPKIIAKNDLCFTNSAYLMDYCKQYNPHSYDIGQGCNVPAMTTAGLAELDDLSGVHKPIIGYVGALQSIRLDIELLAYIASHKPHWSLVLVGPEDEQFAQSELHSFSNIFFTGSKKANELMHYIQAFDVCINPQLINQLTIGNYPRKIDEYLTLGKPVVATHTRAMDMFQDFVLLASDKHEFLQQLERAVAEQASAETIGKRKAFAASHSWENSVGKMYGIMETYLSKLNNK